MIIFESSAIEPGKCLLQIAHFHSGRLVYSCTKGGIGPVLVEKFRPCGPASMNEYLVVGCQVPLAFNWNGTLEEVPKPVLISPQSFPAVLAFKPSLFQSKPVFNGGLSPLLFEGHLLIQAMLIKGIINRQTPITIGCCKTITR